MKNGFTLIEVLAVLIILGILAVIIFPTINGGLASNTNKALEIEKNNIISAAKDWSLNNLSKLPQTGNSIKIKILELKDEYLPVGIKNPKTGAFFSNESYILISNNNDDYTYEVYMYDIPEEIISDEKIKFVGNFLTEEVDVNSVIGNFEIEVINNDNEKIEYSKQCFLNNEEIIYIDTSKKGTYSIIYTVLYDEQIYKAVKTIIIK